MRKNSRILKKTQGFWEKTQEFWQKTQGILTKTQKSANFELVNSAGNCPKIKPAYSLEVAAWTYKGSDVNRYKSNGTRYVPLSRPGPLVPFRSMELSSVTRSVTVPFHVPKWLKLFPSLPLCVVAYTLKRRKGHKLELHNAYFS